MDVIFSNTPLNYCIDYIKERYPYGVVGVIGVDDNAINALRKTHVIDSGKELKEEARFVLVNGDVDSLRAYKRQSAHRECVVLGELPYYELFSSKFINGKQITVIKTPKLVVFDSEKVDKQFELMALEIVFKLVFALSDRLLLQGRTKKDTLAKELHKCLKETLIGDVDTETVVRILAPSVSLLERIGYSEFMDYFALVSGEGNREIGTPYNLYSIFLAILLTIQFTKCKISDILITSDVVRVRALIEKLGLEFPPPKQGMDNLEFLKQCNRDLLFDIETLANLREWFVSGYGKRSAPLQKILNDFLIATALSPTHGLIGELALSGFIEGVIDEIKN